MASSVPEKAPRKEEKTDYMTEVRDSWTRQRPEQPGEEFGGAWYDLRLLFEGHAVEVEFLSRFGKVRTKLPGKGCRSGTGRREASQAKTRKKHLLIDLLLAAGGGFFAGRQLGGCAAGI